MASVRILGDESGVIYVVTSSGDLLWYKDLAQDGTANWAGGKKIGDGWDAFLQVFSGGDGIIYAVNPSGDLLWYKDLARNGTDNWAKGGTGLKIGGPGWDKFLQVFSGGDGIIYAITSTGDLLWYKDLARNGTDNWANGGTGLKIGGPGWDKFLQVFSGGDGIIYAVNPSGDLLFYKDQAQDGTDNWANGGTGLKIGGDGWNNFRHVFPGGDGIIYAVTQSGDLLWYKDLARDGTMNWAGIGVKIDEGWTFE